MASVGLTVVPVVSYALAHNEIPVVTRLTVGGVDRAVAGAVLRLEVADAVGPLAEPLEVLVDLEAGRPAVLTDVKLRLDPARMLQVEEQRPGTVRAVLEIDGVVEAEAVATTRVLAGSQWLAVPQTLGLELLAAHVQPNSPAVRNLMDDVAARLAAWTGSPDIQGYQAGPERADQIAECVYAAVQARAIRYAEPPPSWADDGQKVRTPDEVLDGRVGTCLDLTLTMSAALEHAGIRPLLWVVEGHAFLGWWRVESSLGTVADLDVAGAVNRVDLDVARVVETTALTGPTRFEEARRLAYDRHLAGDLSRVLGVVDVHQAREHRIVPLPARTRDPDGTVHISVYQPAARPGPADAARAPATVPGRPAEPPRVTRWKNALLDLSLRNRLLNVTGRGALPVVVSPAGVAKLENALHDGGRLTLRAADELTEIDRRRGLTHARELDGAQLDEMLSARTVHVDVPAAAYATRMRNLAYKARTIVEETGANNLYLALGALVWELDGRPLRSPLVLAPVTLRPTARGGAYRLELDETGQSTPNFCLVEKLRQLHGLELPGLADPAMDEAGIDVDAAFAAVRAAIVGLPYRVEPTADLAVLQFAKFRLWKDLDESWPELAANPLVEHLIRTPTDAFADPVPPPQVPDLDGLDETCPVPADASQLRAVAEAVAGSTFVLEGPPGTGKSQTITNLLVRAVAEGKRVLFVAEKRAALDVVRGRLDAVGMGPLSLDLHDKGAKPTAVRARISRALEHVVVPDRSEHAIRVEELRAARRSLTRYAYRLHERNAAGLSLYDARHAVLAYDPGDVPLPVPVGLLRGEPADVERLRVLFGTVQEVAAAARPRTGHPWGFVDSPVVDVAAVTAAARRFDAVALPDSPGVRAARTPDDLGLLADLLESGLPLAVLDEARTPRWAAAVDDARRRVEVFAASPQPGLDLATPAALELPLDEIAADARAAAASGWFGRRRRLKAVRERLALRPGAAVPPKRVPELAAALVELRDRVRELARSVTAIPGLVLPEDWSPFRPDVIEARAAEVRRLAGPAADGARRATLAAPVDPRPVRAAAVAASALRAVCGSGDFVAGWRDAERDLDEPESRSLRRWVDLLGHLEPLRTAGLHEARAAVLTGAVDPDDARRAFEHGLAVASVPERLAGLDGFDRAAHERSIDRFVAASRAVRAQLETVLPADVLARRTFDPRSTGGTVGQLQRQLSRRRGGMKIRELMTAYGEVVTGALPCVLVSPDSLARFFPATAGLFDVVVFDEASQVRVADAIGAMGRSRSVVVVGDSKQMPPTSFAESAYVDEELGADEVEDEESILTECVQARVRRHRLSWHYRSRDEALIAFSNLSYYDGGLATFPAPPQQDTGVSLVRVDGTFHRSGPLLRTNPVEAEAVVAEIVRRFAGPVAPSLGVVTFNVQQRTLIENLLRDTGDERLVEALEAPDGLFVKNLENVQGDERDVVLFSTAFSVNQRGVLPLNFGPLNRSGGERRLNVAITRARRQVIVFSSFEPAQLRAEETSSVGLRHLRAYLEMAAYGTLPGAALRRALPDRHREEIAARLRARGVPVRTSVGLSDFTLDLVLGDARVAVLLDGVPWSQRLTARDRDALPHEVLREVLGWPAVSRVWLPEWLASPEAVLDRLEAAYREPPAAAAPPAPEVPALVPREVPEPEVQAGPAVFVPWAPRVLGTVDVLDALPGRTTAARVAAALAEVVAAEGPVHVVRLTTLVATAFGLRRTSEGRRVAILRHLPAGLVVDDAEPVVWPADLDPATWTGYRPSPDTARPLAHVPLRELVNAMAAVARASAGISRDELHRAVLATFGGRRLTEGLAARLDEAVELGRATGRLTGEEILRSGPS